MRRFYLYITLVSLILSSIFFFYLEPPIINDKIINIAHRGASGYAPENTFAAFDKAIQMNVDYIELDIHLSKDNHLVVIHDHTVNRTTNGIGLVKDLTINQLKQLDAGSWFHEDFKNERIPTLQEVFIEYGNQVGLLIEIKNPSLYPGIEKKLAEVIYTNLALQENLDIKIQSFYIQSIKKMKAYFPSPSVQINLGLIIKNFVSYRDLINISNHTDFINIHKNYISRHLVLQAHQVGLKIYAWTVNDLRVLKLLLNRGIDGVIVDYPELIQYKAN
jgi:glycerophosphoryl diester phosphodiesterase